MLHGEHKKSVTISEADNGFVVSSYDFNGGGEKKFIAKTKDEAFKAVVKLFNMKTADRELGEKAVGRMG